MNPQQDHTNKFKLIDQLKNEIDLEQDEVLNLDDQIMIAETQLKKLERENKAILQLMNKKPNKKELLEALKKEKDNKQVLQSKVEQYLEFVEEMEANDLFDEERAEQLLLQAKAEQDKEIGSLKAKIEAATKELETKLKARKRID